MHAFNATKITNVAETRTRDSRDLTRESKMGIKNETKVVSRQRRDRVIASEHLFRFLDIQNYYSGYLENNF